MLKQIHLNTFLAVPRYILHDLTGDTRCEIGDRLDSVRLARNNIPLCARSEDATLFIFHIERYRC